jgi:hypothetical protein
VCGLAKPALTGDDVFSTVGLGLRWHNQTLFETNDRLFCVGRFTGSSCKARLIAHFSMTPMEKVGLTNLRVSLSYQTPDEHGPPLSLKRHELKPGTALRPGSLKHHSLLTSNLGPPPGSVIARLPRSRALGSPFSARSCCDASPGRWRATVGDVPGEAAIG